jgi:hypothetical protein
MLVWNVFCNGKFPCEVIRDSILHPEDSSQAPGQEASEVSEDRRRSDTDPHRGEPSIAQTGASHIVLYEGSATSGVDLEQLKNQDNFIQLACGSLRKLDLKPYKNNTRVQCTTQNPILSSLRSGT